MSILDATASKALSQAASCEGGGSGSAGQNGATFFPVITESNDQVILSWTNDQDLENPEPINIKGDPGSQGIAGSPGIQGSPGFSPVVSIIEGTDSIDGAAIHTLTIQDASDTYTTIIKDGQRGEQGETGPAGSSGQDGLPGQDGFSPIVSIIDGTDSIDGCAIHTLTIEDSVGTSTAIIRDGLRGETGPAGSAGAAGFSPVVTLTGGTGSYLLSVTDAQGSTDYPLTFTTPSTVTDERLILTSSGSNTSAPTSITFEITGISTN